MSYVLLCFVCCVLFFVLCVQIVKFKTKSKIQERQQPSDAELFLWSSEFYVLLFFYPYAIMNHFIFQQIQRNEIINFPYFSKFWQKQDTNDPTEPVYKLQFRDYFERALNKISLF